MGRAKLNLAEVVEQRNFYKKEVASLTKAIEEEQKIAADLLEQKADLERINRQLERRIWNIETEADIERTRMYDKLELQNNISLELSRRIIRLDNEISELHESERYNYSNLTNSAKSVMEAAGTPEKNTCCHFEPEVKAGSFLEEQQKRKRKNK